MIDTIVLTFDEDQYQVTKLDNFEPSLRILLDFRGGWGGRAYMKFKNNPTNEDYAKGVYRPRLTITSRFKDKKLQNMLKVEFSAPKMLYGNNFDELTDADLSELVNRLYNSLEKAGVLIWRGRDQIFNANVSAVHYSKNLIFQDCTLASMYAKEVRKCNVTLRLDSNSTDYRNEGHSVKFRANSFEVTFYDKIRDLEQTRISPKRTEEKKDNLLQMGLFDDIQAIRSTHKKPFEVLRFEVRLNQRKKIDQILNKIRIDVPSLTLKELFKGKISQSVLLYYLKELKVCYPKPLLCAQKAPESILSELIVNNPQANIKDIFAFVGMAKSTKQEGVREMRKAMGAKRNRAWSRLTKTLNGLQIAEKAANPFDPLLERVKEFKTVRLADYKDQINNSLENVGNAL